MTDDIVIHARHEDGSLDSTIDGKRRTVPDNPRNTHRQMIAEWEAEGNTLPDYVEPGPSADDVIAERDRRLAAGFDYDFGDARGVHTIATADRDMRGWDEVTKGAQAAINLGQPGTTFTIVTETGPVSVTALEWQAVLAAATAFRQPIWAASFALQSMDPIPADFATNETHWGAAQ